MNFYSYEEIDEIGALYNLIIGRRMTGKTFGVCRKIVDAYLDEDLPSAYVCRFDELIKPSYIDTLFNPQIDYIIQKTEGKWNGFVYRGNAFYLARYDQSPVTGRNILKAKDIKPICWTHAIQNVDKKKIPDRGLMKYIVFDEFISKWRYLRNEFVLWNQILSDIIKGRTEIKIYMLGNSYDKFCPYFKEMGLTKIQDQKPGTIEVYRLGQTESKIAVEILGYNVGE